MSTAIKIENLSKQYRLGLVGTNTLHGDIKHWWAKMRGREKDLYKIGEENKLSEASGEYVWALRDINLEVQQGEVLGIIGKNGAGKSTLLKILSQVTGPTTGSIKVKGRIASLLEVGTGFHGELTGRENIFLNGAILGMKRHEIIRKFDEIVDFAGVAKYIDTPVKRYSSGMYVRLAFAVAAFLEPEILVVDEVLAVGDAEFQKKAIGKMQDVSTNEGRTVLFVSHNMASVQALCSTGIMVTNGSISYRGSIKDTVEKYSATNIKLSTTSLGIRTDRRGDQKIKFSKVAIINEKDVRVSSVPSGGYLIIRVWYRLLSNEVFKNCRASVSLAKRNDSPLIILSSELVNSTSQLISSSGYIDFKINRLPLSQGMYQLNFFIESMSNIHDWINNAATLEVESGTFYHTGKSCPAGWDGKTVLIDHEINFHQQK